eukprot:6373197-Prymnesium_polylepis.1
MADWRSYKAELKQYIYEFDGDAHYRDNKLKVGSLRQHECFVGAIDSEYAALPGEKLAELIDGRGPILPAFENPLGSPLLWLSLIMPRVPKEPSTAQQSRAAHGVLRMHGFAFDAHMSAAVVHDAAELDDSEKNWLVRVASAQAQADMPSYATDTELLASSPVSTASAASPPSASVAGRLLAALGGVAGSVAAPDTGTARERRAPDAPLPRDTPLRWPYLSTPGFMGCMVASPTHLASAVVEGNVRVDCVGR